MIEPSAFTKYASQRLLLHLQGNPDTLEEPHSRTFQGAVLMADMQNFTILAERLNREDPAHGVETLARYLDIYIGRLVDIITTCGGDIVKFAGDAVFALWEDESMEAPLLEAVRAAVRCGLMVQRQLHRFEVAPDTMLALRVGIEAGTMHELHLGGYRDRWEFLIAGAPMTRAGVAGTRAEPGEVVLASKAARILENAGGRRSNGRHLKIPQIQESALSRPLQRMGIVPQAKDALNVYIPRALLVADSRMKSEIRPVTVLFCKVKGFHFSADAAALPAVQIIMLIMQECVYRYEGSLNRFGVDEKGAILLAAFGLPPLVHDDDPVRGILAARDIRKALESVGHDASVGVSTGRAFCGTVGNDTRCEYTLHGINVNLAARLMTKAESILVDQHTYDASKDKFQFEEQPPMFMKGLATNIHTYRPL